MPAKSPHHLFPTQEKGPKNSQNLYTQGHPPNHPWQHTPAAASTILHCIHHPVLSSSRQRPTAGSTSNYTHQHRRAGTYFDTGARRAYGLPASTYLRKIYHHTELTVSFTASFETCDSDTETLVTLPIYRRFAGVVDF